MAKIPFLKNLDEEVRYDYTITTEQKKLWSIQLQLYGKLYEVCERHGLKLFATYGTAIGAVRDKGFIPWDNDMDFAMLRPDYDKLASIAEQEFEAPYKYQTAYTDEGYYRAHAQLRLDGTTAILPHDFKRHYVFHQGIFIDIFVLDGVPEDEKERKQLADESRLILDYLWKRRYWRNRIDFKNFKLLKKLLGEKAQWSDKKLFTYFEDLFRKHSVESSRRIGPISFNPTREASYYRKETHDSVVFMPFEEGEMPVPVGYDEMLSQCYKSYRTPMHNKTTHGTIWVSTNEDFSIYKKKRKSRDISFLFKEVKRVIKLYLFG